MVWETCFDRAFAVLHMASKCAEHNLSILVHSMENAVLGTVVEMDQDIPNLGVAVASRMEAIDSDLVGHHCHRTFVFSWLIGVSVGFHPL